jgi:group I intron endonuclease
MLIGIDFNNMLGVKKNVIYCIENLINHKLYIGSTNYFNKRKQLHLKRLNSNIHHSKILQNSWNKYGENNFIFKILEEVKDKKELLKREQWYIDNYNCEFNVCKVAGSSLGVKRSEKTKQKIRQSNLGIKHPAWRNKIKSKSQGGQNHWTKNKKFSEQAKINMSNAQKRLYTQGYQHPNKKIIIQLDLKDNFIKEWESVTKASQELKINMDAISNCARKKSKTSGGFKWIYK